MMNFLMFLYFMFAIFLIFVIIPICVWKFIDSYKYYCQFFNSRLNKFEKFTLAFFPSLFDSFVWFIVLLVLSPILCPIGYIDSLMLLLGTDPANLISFDLAYIVYYKLLKRNRKNGSR